MKKSLLICGFMVLNLAGAASAAVVADKDWTVDTVIPDGNPTGITTYQTFSSLPSAPITSVAVDLNISGGFNGDLYAALTYQPADGSAAVTEILLNQVGTSPSNPFGSAGSGFNVTLNDSGTANGSIHNATGNPVGIWLPDSVNTLNGTFGGLSDEGTWTLFIADLSVGGGAETLNSWGLDINAAVVPEPANTGLFLSSSGLMAVTLVGWFRQQRKKLPMVH
jgi:subtilisin-like proprotein convertase family protein